MVMCRRYLKNNPVKLGAEGVVCQVDESMFAYKPKHHEVEHWKLRDGYVHCVFITVYKKCKIVIMR
jgi:hypothetical protein